MKNIILKLRKALKRVGHAYYVAMVGYGEALNNSRGLAGA